MTFEDNISTDKGVCVNNLCTTPGIKVHNGCGKKADPPYLILFFRDRYLGTAYGSKFVFSPYLDAQLVAEDSLLLKKLAERLNQIYSGNTLNSRIWQKQ